MIIPDLLGEISYKFIFNEIQKTFYPLNSYSVHEVTDKDFFYYRLYSSFKSFENTTLIENFTFYILELEGDTQKFDLCVLDGLNDELTSIDLYSVKNLCSMEIVNPANINNKKWLADFFYKCATLPIKFN